MERLSKEDLAQRLGFDLLELDFLGQCYDAGPGNERVCAVTQQQTRHCFTLKPKSGKGRRTVSPEAFPHIEQHNPDLYIKLQTGLAWLMMREKQVTSEVEREREVQRLRSIESKYKSVRSTARRRLATFRKESKHAELTPTLFEVNQILTAKEPEFQTAVARTLWLQQETIRLERALFSDGGPVPTPTPSTTSSLFDAIPELF